MKETNIYIKVRYYGGTYIAKVYEPKLNFTASCTHSAALAAERCAEKAGGRKPLRLELCASVSGQQRYRAVFGLNEKAHRRERAAGDVEMQTGTESARSRSVQRPC